VRVGKGGGLVTTPYGDSASSSDYVRVLKANKRLIKIMFMMMKEAETRLNEERGWL